MTRLPILCFLFFVFCLLFVTPSFAQEASPTITSPPQTQGNAWENFKNMFIPDTLKNVNCAGLPLDACMEVKNINITGNTTNSTVKAQANSPDNADTVSSGAFEYTVASGMHTPAEVSKASTSPLDVFAGILNLFDQIFNRGETEAKNYAGTSLPSDVTNQNFAQQQPADNSFASGNSDVLGASDQPNSAMDKALPLLQCASLPAGLCSGNRPNIISQ